MERIFRYQVFNIDRDFNVDFSTVKAFPGASEEYIVIRVLVNMLYPLDWLDDYQGEFTPSFMTYQDWLWEVTFTDELTGNRKWMTSEAVKLSAIRRPLQISFIHHPHSPARGGAWDNFSVVIKKDARRSLKLLNASFTGALLGGVLSQFCVSVLSNVQLHALTSKLEASVKKLAVALGLTEYSSLRLALPERNSTSSRVYLNTDESGSVSFTTMDGKSVEKFILGEVNDIFKVKAHFPEYLSIMNTVPVKVAFAKLLDSKREEISAKDPSEKTGSDPAWETSLFTGLLGFQLGYAVARWNPTPPSILVGCRGKEESISMIWTRCTEMKQLVTYNPPGLNHGRGLNCVIDCIDVHLQKCERDERYRTKYTSSYNFVNDTWVRMKSFSHLSMESDFDHLARISKLPLIVTLVVEVPTPRPERFHPLVCRYTKTVVYNRKENMEEENSCALLVYSNQEALYHAALLKEPAFRERAQCAQCHRWFKYPNSYNFKDDVGKKARAIQHFETCYRCAGCFQWVNKGGKHSLSCAKKKYVSPTIDGEVRRMQINGRLAEELELDQYQWFADFECFADNFGNHVPYLAVLKLIGDENEPFIYYGADCMKKFVAKILSNDVYGYLWFHNGSGYDFILLLRALLTYGGETFDTTEILKRGTKILSAEVKHKPHPLHLRDFILFVMGALARLCVDFKVPGHYKKTSFDHSKIKSFADARIHQDEATLYCVQDVKVGALFISFLRFLECDVE